jgi:hypothetical protein
MKKVIYRIQFRFESIGDIQKKRDSRIDSLLSSLDNIDTEKPIVAPFKGSVVEVDGTDYEVTGNKLQFVVEEDIVFYTTIVSLTPHTPPPSVAPKTDKVIDSDALKRYLYGKELGKYEQKQSNEFWKLGGWDTNNYVPKSPIV